MYFFVYLSIVNSNTVIMEFQKSIEMDLGWNAGLNWKLVQEHYLDRESTINIGTPVTRYVVFLRFDNKGPWLKRASLPNAFDAINYLKTVLSYDREVFHSILIPSKTR